MKINNVKKLKPKKLIVFDLDGTIAPTKAPMDKEMASLVQKLLEKKKVAIIGGGKLELFKHQFLNHLKIPGSLYKHLYLFPTTATTFLRYHKSPCRSGVGTGPGRWKRIYAHNLTKTEVKKIKTAFTKVLKQINYLPPKKIYGKVLENRGSQVTWSALGQDVVKVLGKKGIALKHKWRDKNTPLKLKIGRLVQKELPNLEVHVAGHTSIDVTKNGIDKAYGLRQMEKHLDVKIKDMLFVGDAIFPGGNDYAVVKTKVDYIKVKTPNDTKKIIRHIIK